jgi:hypothetical protein
MKRFPFRINRLYQFLGFRLCDSINNHKSTIVNPIAGDAMLFQPFCCLPDS